MQARSRRRTATARRPGPRFWIRGPATATPWIAAGPNNGSTAGSVVYGPGLDGSAFAFGGNGSYVALGTGPDITGTGAFAVGAWIKTTSDGMIINQRDVNNVNGEYVLQVAGGKINWYTHGDSTPGFNITSNSSVADGQWHYVLAERLASGTGEIFIDGVLDSSQAAAPVPLGSGINVYIWRGRSQRVLRSLAEN